MISATPAHACLESLYRGIAANNYPQRQSDAIEIVARKQHLSCINARANGRLVGPVPSHSNCTKQAEMYLSKSLIPIGLVALLGLASIAAAELTAPSVSTSAD